MDEGVESTASSRALSQPWYSATVVALAAFIIGAIAFREPIVGYTAQAVVEQEVASDVGETCLCEENVSLRPNDRIHIQRHTPQHVRATLQCTDRFPGECQKRCRELAESIARAQPTVHQPDADLIQSRRDDVQRRLALARQSERSAQEELARTSSDQLAEFALAMKQAEMNRSRAISKSPEQQEFESSLAALTDQRRELARTRTDEHPMIRELDERIQSLQSKIAELGSERPEVAQSESLPISLEDLQDQFREENARLQAVCDDARRRCEQLEEETARLATTSSPTLLQTRVVEPATVLTSVGGRPSIARLGSIGFFSLACGAAVLVLNRLTADEGKFHSASQVSSQLELPIATITGIVRPRQLSRAARTLRGTVFVCEVLIAVLILTGAATFSTIQTIHTPTENPFVAMAEAMDRVGSFGR